MLGALTRLTAWVAAGAGVAVAIVALDLGLAGSLIAAWFVGTTTLLGTIAWRARRTGERARVELLWDDRPP